MPKAVQDMTHAELVELSRAKARERDRLAREASARGCYATAMQHREIAARYREEVDMQEGVGR